MRLDLILKKGDLKLKNSCLRPADSTALPILSLKQGKPVKRETAERSGMDSHLFSDMIY
jgi:hypothetical protein